MRAIRMLLVLAALMGPAMAGAFGAGADGDAVPGQKENTTAPPVVREHYAYDDVCPGTDCAGRDGGKGYDSLADWKLRWDYGRRSGPALCAADSFTVTLDITFHLPKWAGGGETPRALAEARERYTKHLLAHEQRHGEIMLDAARELTRAVGDLPSARSCAELDESLQRLVEERLAKLCDDQRGYDAATDHGAVEGLSLP